MRREKYKEKLQSKAGIWKKAEEMEQKTLKDVSGRKYQRKDGKKMDKEEAADQKRKIEKKPVISKKPRDGPEITQGNIKKKKKARHETKESYNIEADKQPEEMEMPGQLFRKKLSDQKKTFSQDNLEKRVFQGKELSGQRFHRKKKSIKQAEESYKAKDPLKGIKQLKKPAGVVSKYHVRNLRESREDEEHDESTLQKTQEIQVATVYHMKQAIKTAGYAAGRRYKTNYEKQLINRKEKTDAVTTKSDLLWQEHKNQMKRFKVRADSVFKEENVKDSIVKVTKKLAEVATRNEIFLFIVVLFICIFIAAGSAAGVFAQALEAAGSNLLEGYSQATDQSLTDADSYYSALEAKLQERIDNIETEKPGFDEYVLDVADIGHDPNLMMAYLSAAYGNYDLSMVQGALDSLFSDMYKLEFEETQEERTDNNGNTYLHCRLTVILTKKNWDELMEARILESQKQAYETYTETGGMHQAFASPFSDNWSGNISSSFGWRIHPISGEEKFHKGVDIALPLGTEVKSCSSGTVVKSYYSDSAGNYVVVRDESGYECHYMHLNDRNVSAGDKVTFGSKIGTVGTTGRSTGPHLHLGIKDAEGKWLNPAFMVQGGM